MTFLLDINVLVALAWPNHVHHLSAHEWFGSEARSWATCALTETGFVRVSSNRAAIPTAVTPREAVALLRQMTALPGHRFWMDDVSLVETPQAMTDRLNGHRQVTDAHLIALTRRHEGRLATFDRKLATLLLPTDDPASLLEVIP